MVLLYRIIQTTIVTYLKNQICKIQQTHKLFKFAIYKFKFKNSILEFEICNFFCNFAKGKINANIVIMEENFATRLKLFMESINVQSSQFADMCEIPRPSFSQLLSGRNQKVSDTLIRKIHAAYPDLSIMWLMFGEGPMLSSQKTNKGIEASTSESPSSETVKSSETLHNDSTNSEYSNVKALNQDKSKPNHSIYQQLEDNKKILELQLQIEKMQKNPRRVAQITVYYDDSTFETFIPSKSK